MKQTTKILFITAIILLTTALSANNEPAGNTQAVAYAKQSNIVHYDNKQNALQDNIVYYDNKRNGTLHYDTKASYSLNKEK